MANIFKLRELTEVDKRAHRDEVLKLERCLVDRRIAAVEPIEPSVHVLGDLVTGKAKRDLLRGGLRYRFAFPGAVSSVWIGVQHWNSAHYWLHASMQVPSKPLGGYTRVSKLVLFEDAAREFVSCIDVLEAECRAARYVSAPNAAIRSMQR